MFRKCGTWMSHTFSLMRDFLYSFPKKEEICSMEIVNIFSIVDIYVGETMKIIFGKFGPPLIFLANSY